MKLYKLTDANGQTKGGMQWGEGVTHIAVGEEDQPLCSNGWIHAYEHPVVALLLNPVHGNFTNPQLWEAEGEVGEREGELKCGCRSLTTVRRIDRPDVRPEQRVRFAIAVAWQFGSGSWRNWAVRWLDNTDRSAWVAAEVAAEAAAAWVAEAAWAAAEAAAAWVAEAAWAAWAAWVAEAAEAAAKINFAQCAEWALTNQPITAIFAESV